MSYLSRGMVQRFLCASFLTALAHARKRPATRRSWRSLGVDCGESYALLRCLISLVLALIISEMRS